MMIFLKNNRGKLLIAALFIFALAFSFFKVNISDPADKELSPAISVAESYSPSETVTETDTSPAVAITDDEPDVPKADIQKVTPATEEFSENDSDDATETNTTAKNFSDEPENDIISDKEFTCSLCVRCDTVFDNMARLLPEKTSIIPSDGFLLTERTVSFTEGESVFNVLEREMRKNGIHFEFAKTPMYDSSYIEGIGNLYEFDCGELSGWMYRVNGVFPNFGCSQYYLKHGDKVEWIYTCDLGRDIGGDYYKNNN